MNPKARIINSTGNTIKINNDLDIVFTASILNDVLAGSSVTVTTSGLENYVTGQISSTNISNLPVFIGNIGTKTCENAVLSAMSGSNISFTAIKYNHKSGEHINFMGYDMIEISKNGTVFATINLQLSEEYTIYRDMGGILTDKYTFRFKNSKDSSFSKASGSISPVLSYTTAQYIIDEARGSIGNVSVTDEFLISAINRGRGIVDSKYAYSKLNDWRQQFDYIIPMVAGKNYIDLPSDIDFTNNNRSVLNVRYIYNTIATPIPIRYIDKQTYNSMSWRNQGINVVSYSGTTLTLESTRDLPPTGTITLSSDGNGIIRVSYTGNNKTTATLSGLTGNTRTISAGDQAWLAPNLAPPLAYTVYENRIYFNTTIPTILDGRSVYLDYFTKLVPINDMYDEIPEHYRNAYQHFLRWAIKRRRDDTLGEDDPDYQEFKQTILGVIGNDSYNQGIGISNG